ncbi:MAG: halocarboxylic acid dehydrogenase DehI family protein [Pseudomonadota bacterium]
MFLYPRHSPPLVAGEEASAAIREIYVDIAASLRSTWTPDVFKALAVWPALLQEAWRQLAPNVRTRFFEESADRLRLKAAETAAPLLRSDFFSAALGKPRLAPEARALIAGYHYVCPKTLLAIATLRRALRAEGFGLAPTAWEELVEIPSAPPEGMPPLDPPAAEDMAPAARVVLRDVRRTLEGPPPPLLQSLGRWPDLLEETWDVLGTARGHELYGTRLADLLELAERQAAHLPYVVDLRPEKMIGMGYSPSEVAAAVAYFESSSGEAVLLTAALQVVVRGRAAAMASPYPVPEEKLS